MSFQQGLSGLNASSKNLEVIGNNIANANTVGAKTSRAEFADMFASSLSGAQSNSAGIGVNLAAVAQQFGQGNISTTGNGLDLAVNGRGFFQVMGAKGETQYTRNGQFKLDRDGYVVNSAGLQLLAQKWNEAAGRPDGEAVAVKMTAGLGAAIATGQGSDPELAGVRLAMNLKATDPVNTTAIDFARPSTYNYATSQTLFDGVGAQLSMTYYFKKTAEETWKVYGTVDGVPYDGAAGTGLLTTLTFDPTTGRLDEAGETAAQFVPTTDVGPLAAFPFDFKGITQFATSNYSVSEMKQDGYTAGAMTGIQFDNSGLITATYSNGRSENLGRVQLADFTNLQGLQSLGGNLWASTFVSGEATRGSPATGTLGSLQAGALEDSNVDLTGELVNMITAQRIYQANAQTIKAQDQMLQTLVNLR